jgi:hypothetical protein
MKRKPRVRGFPRAAAFHEAAHAVARLQIVGAPATAIEITRTGAGRTHGTGRRWVVGRGPRLAWNLILYALAGSYAEACVSRRSLARILATAGRGDLAKAAPAVVWLVAHGHARNTRPALDHAHRELIVFLAQHWDAVESVAAALREHGRLNGRQVRILMSAPACGRAVRYRRP